jgi:hypothetical protein
MWKAQMSMDLRPNCEASTAGLRISMQLNATTSDGAETPMYDSAIEGVYVCGGNDCEALTSDLIRPEFYTHTHQLTSN